MSARCPLFDNNASHLPNSVRKLRVCAVAISEFKYGVAKQPSYCFSKKKGPFAVGLFSIDRVKWGGLV